MAVMKDIGFELFGGDIKLPVNLYSVCTLSGQKLREPYMHGLWC